MVTIRLARHGSKRNPFYKIVAAEKSAPRDGRFIEQIGYYDPRRKVFHYEAARYDHWVGVGAQASDTVKQLVKKARKGAPADAGAAEAKA